MILLDGKGLAKRLKEELKVKVEEAFLKYNKKPKLAIVMVGNNPASEIYVRNKIKDADLVGMDSKLIHESEDISQEELMQIIFRLNEDSTINGIIVQLPLPKHLDEQAVINYISDSKDVDGFGLLNKGKLFSGLPCIPSATPYGIIKLLDAYNVPIKGKHAVVVGRSNIVGKPMAILLLDRHATVTICHSRTENLKEITKTADILVVAIGKPRFITSDMVKENACVVDVGTNRVDGVLCGDVDFDEVSKKCSYISPVPKGVGPLTIVSLLENTYTTFINQNM